MPIRNDVSVTPNEFSTSVNGGRRLVKLDNGTLVSLTWSATSQSGQGKYFLYKSTNNGGSWSLCTTIGDTASASYYDTGGSIVSAGNYVYALIPYRYPSGGVHNADFYKIDVSSVTVVSTGSATVVGSGGMVQLGYTSMVYNPTDNSIHAVWSIRHNTSYTASYNIQYRKGTVSLATGNVTWNSPEWITKVDISGNNCHRPTVTIDKNGIPCIVFSTTGFRIQTSTLQYGNSIVFMKKSNELARDNNYMNSTHWSYYTIWSETDTSFTHDSPSAIFVPQSVNGLANGRIWITWHGMDATDGVNQIRVVYSDDGGLTWSTRTKLTSGTLANVTPSITADRNNVVDIVCEGLISSSVTEVKRIKWNGSWGAPTTITNTGTNADKTPSTLFDLSLNTTAPLFIYKSSGKVGFYGTWTIITISVTPGSIGTKTDRTNLLTYTITSDGTMGTVTEKYNGNLIGTKTPTSGQSVMVSLTQPQWDTISYGKYTGGANLNTLTIEMGLDKWTYTFDKRLISTDNSASMIKSIQDIQNNYLPSIKTKLASAIVGKGGIAAGTDSFETLLDTLSSLQTKRFASGTITSSSTQIECFHPTGQTTSTLDTCTYVDITGLSFTPSYVLIWNNAVNGWLYLTIYDVRLNVYMNPAHNIMIHGTTTGSTNFIYYVGNDVLNLKVTQALVRLPVPEANMTQNWIAIE